MFGKNFFVFTTTLFTFLAAMGCADQNRRDQPSTGATFKGYWMVDESLDLMSQASKDDSCSSLMDQNGLHTTKETIDLPIISIWGDGSVFALDTLIKTGVEGTAAHPDSVTAANIPGRFVLQGRLFAEGTFTPVENGGFTMAPFEVEELEQQQMFFDLEETNVLSLEIKPKKSAEKPEEQTPSGEPVVDADEESIKENSGEFQDDTVEVAEVDSSVEDNDGAVEEEPEVETEEVEPFRLVYFKLTLKEYRDFVNFSQTCLDSGGK